MEESEVSDLNIFLENARLLHLLPAFEAQKIDEASILAELSENEINILTNNSIGDKIKLKRAIKSISHADDIQNNASSSNYSPPAKIPKLSNVEGNDSSNAKLNLTIQEDTDFSNLPVILVNELGQITGEDVILHNNQESISTATTLTVGSSAGYVSDDHTTGSDVPSTSQFNTSEFSQNAISLFELNDFLKSDIIGQALLLKSQLTNSDRDRLSEIVIKHMINKYGRLSNDSLNILAKKILKIFPLEKASTYFVPPIPKCRSSKNTSERSRGKLADKQRNLFWLINTINKKEKITTEKEEDKPNDEVISQEARDSCIWLKKNSGPTTEVLHHWEKSYPIRKFEPSETIDAFIEKWPALKSPMAPELVSLDFKMLHPQLLDESFDLETVFNNFWDQILEIRKNCLTAVDSTLLAILDGEITTNSRSAIQLYLLPALVPPKTRIQVKKSNWKPSVSEARDTLILHVKIPGDVQSAKQNQIDLCFNKGLTVQPYIILIGPTLSNISGALVIINQQEYKCLSVLDAMNFCFKIYQILDAKYPFPCSHLWYLIQWRVYKYFTKNDPIIPHINDLL